MHKIERTTERFLPVVLDRGACVTHNVPVGIPCFHLARRDGYYAGICDSRARKAGFVGKISPESLTKAGAKRSKK